MVPMAVEHRLAAGQGAEGCPHSKSLRPWHPSLDFYSYNQHSTYSILKFFQVDKAGMFRMTSSARYFR